MGTCNSRSILDNIATDSGMLDELCQAGELMYYAGDIAELLLAFALVSS